MTESRTPPLAPACFGVCCDKHHKCARYAAVNGAPMAMRFIGTCDETRKTRPGYVPLLEAK